MNIHVLLLPWDFATEIRLKGFAVFTFDFHPKGFYFGVFTVFYNISSSQLTVG